MAAYRASTLILAFMALSQAQDTSRNCSEPESEPFASVQLDTKTKSERRLKQQADNVNIIAAGDIMIGVQLSEATEVINYLEKQELAAQQKLEEETAKKASAAALAEYQNYAKAVTGVNDSMKAAIPTVKSCFESSCDGAVLAEQLLQLSSAVMMQIKAVQPWGPIIATVSSWIALFLQKTPTSTPPLTVTDIRNSVAKELLNFYLEELQCDMDSFTLSITGEIKAILVVVTTKNYTPSPGVLKMFRDSLPNLVTDIGSICRKVNSGFQALKKLREGIAKTTQASGTCEADCFHCGTGVYPDGTRLGISCKKDKDYKWPSSCYQDLNDVKTDYSTLVNLMASFDFLTDQLSLLVSTIHGIYANNGWDELFDYNLLRLDEAIKPLLEAQEASSPAQKLLSQCLVSIEKNPSSNFLAQSCNVGSVADIDKWSKFGGNMVTWAMRPFEYIGSAFLPISAAYLGAGTTAEGVSNCNYVEMAIFGNAPSCAAKCSDRGAEWVTLGYTTGKGTKKKGCLSQDCQNIADAIEPFYRKTCKDMCGAKCTSGKKVICARPEACLNDICREAVTNTSAWGLD